MASDTNIYRLEEILTEMTDLLDEAEEIVSETADYIIDGRARNHWLKIIRENLQSDDKINMMPRIETTTMKDTISDIWNNYYEYTEEDE